MHAHIEPSYSFVRTAADKVSKGVSRIFPELERRWGFCGRGTNLLPPAKGSGERYELTQRGLQPPKGFPLISALRMASPDTMILLIVDYHAAIGGQDPMPPLRMPLTAWRAA